MPQVKARAIFQVYYLSWVFWTPGLGNLNPKPAWEQTYDISS